MKRKITGADGAVKPRRMPFHQIYLLIALYLFISLGHDVLFFGSPIDFPRTSHIENKFNKNSSLPKHQLGTLNDHYCPFCCGFVDTHVKLVIGFRSYLKSKAFLHASYQPHLHHCLSISARDPPITNP